MNKSHYNTIYLSSWWLCIVTLPWTIPFNSFSLVALAVVCLAEGNFITKWERLKNNTWAWSFLFFFVVHILGLLYTQDSPAGLFEIEKKLGFLAIPLVAASGPLFSKSSFNLLKKSFIYSCLLVVVISLAYTGYSLLGNEAPLIQNFDLQTNQHFHDLNPGASGLWEYFSYIQLGEWIDIHPAYFSMYLIFCIAILVNQMMECRIINARDLSIIILFTFFIVLLSSRMAIVSLTLVMLYFLFHYLKRNLNRKVILLTSLFFVFLFALIFLNPVARFRIIQEPLTTSLQIDHSNQVWNSVSFRWLEWKASLHALRGSWLLGVGTGGGQAALQEFYENFNASTSRLDYNAHDQYLQTAVELGVAGFFGLLLCLWRPFLSSIQPTPIHVAFIILFGLMCLTESMLARQKGIVFFTLFQSLLSRSNYSQ